MLKKILASVISVAAALGLSATLLAQVNINLPASNIVNRTSYSVDLTTGYYTALAGLIPVIDGRANTTAFNNAGNTAQVNLNTLTFRLISIGAINLLGSSQTVTLSTTYQNTYTALATVLSGSVVMRYGITTSGTTWRAGTFTTPFQIRTSQIALLANAISPNIPDLSIIVPAFLTPPTTVSDAVIHIDQLDYFRSLTPSATQTLAVSATVPYTLSVKANSSPFSFSSSTTFNPLPQTSAGLVNVILSNPTGGSQAALSTTSQNISPPGGLDVPANNNTSLTTTFSISNSNLVSGFIDAGTYTVPLTYNWSGSSLTGTTTGQLQVVVDNMADIQVNQPNVDINFQTGANYASGVTTQMPAHVTLSNTTP